jgi:hypothetical protein
MDILTTLLLIFVHALAGWILIELFVNTCHRLPRPVYIILHNLVVAVSFGLVFSFYFRFFAEYSIFKTTLLTTGFILLLEFVVFRFLYSGEKWFLSFIDWLLPIFIATTAIYFAGSSVSIF